MPNPDQIDWNILLRHIQGKTNTIEESAVHEWLKSDPEHKKLLLQLEKLWNNHSTNSESWDVDASWERFKAKYPLHDQTDSLPITYRSAAQKTQYNLNRQPKSRWWYSAAAAIVIALIAVIGVLLHNNHQQIHNPSMQEIVTSKGERTTIRLSDGSQVMLNADSHLKIPSNYGKKTRTIYLKGEAFFRVHHEDKTSFHVYAGHIDVKDIGTKFDISSYEATRPARVIVSEGQVQIYKDDSTAAHRKARMIHAHQVGLITADGRIRIESVTDINQYVGWTKGKLIFQDQSFRAVRKKLARWYDIKTKVTDVSLNEKRLSATFDNESLHEVLKVIGASLAMKVSYKNRVATFSPR